MATTSSSSSSWLSSPPSSYSPRMNSRDEITPESVMAKYGTPKFIRTNSFGDQTFEYENEIFYFMKNPVGTGMFFTGKTELVRRVPSSSPEGK